MSKEFEVKEKNAEGATPEEKKTGARPNLAMGLSLGMLFGLSIGSAMGNLALGIAIGTGFGCSLGLLFEKRNPQDVADEESENEDMSKGE